MQFKSLWVAGSLASALLMTSNAFAANDAWQGFYAGAALGGREQETEWKQDGKLESPFFSGVVDTGFTVKNDSKDSDAYVGLYGGYNWVIGERLVAGVEVAGGYANNQSEKNHIDLAVLGAPTVSQTTVTVRTDWDASLRGRLGFLLTPSVMLYGTGGVAVTRMDASTRCPSDGQVCNPGSPARKDRESDTLVGWTAGFGVETSLTDNLSARAEYQYTEYEEASFWAAKAAEGESYGVHNKVNLATQTLSVGLAYHF